MKVQELKELLKAAGKPVSGKKPDLIARLEEEDAKNAEKINPENADDKVSDIQLSETAYEDMKVQELKELLKAAGKPVSGKKPDLIARLNE
jgi:hypothetical protein